jgi:hypothetical protein
MLATAVIAGCILYRDFRLPGTTAPPTLLMRTATFAVLTLATATITAIVLGN